MNDEYIIRQEIKELKRKLRILSQGRKDNHGGDKFLPGHMVWLTD